MAFKKIVPPQTVPDSPEKILLDLSRRKIQGIYLHQGEVLKSYALLAADAAKVPDVAFQLPTGSGKTLVGLLVAEWRRRKFKERVVFLSPNNQLVNQVAEQADSQYGLSVNAFTGMAKEYSPVAATEYRQAEKVAITTYSALFNTNPFFHDADVIIVDDAHAAENYIAAMWAVRIVREDYDALHTALVNLLKDFIGTNLNRVNGDMNSTADLVWVDKVPTPYLMKVKDEFISILDTHTPGKDIRYKWSVIRDHLLSCHVYLSPNDILIRPLIPPTWSHAPFENATQRIYMSATLGLGGDLERLTGRKNIMRLPIPDGWDRHGIGRRFFMFPELSLKVEQTVELRDQLMKKAGRSVVLVPSKKSALELNKHVFRKLKFETFSADDIEKSKEPFTSLKKAVAIIAGRYDGIDFPGDDCHLLFVDGLPKTTNSQEKFLMSRMGANALFNDRIQTRVLQAMGRCTRTLVDTSAVVVTGSELSNYLSDPRRREFLHPELQAELEFGIEQSKQQTIEEFIENFSVFIENGTEWEKNGNEAIVSIRGTKQQKEFPAMKELASSVEHEIEYQRCLWQEDYEGAYAAAENVLAVINSNELYGYRALWHYLAGCSAKLGKLGTKDKKQFGIAKKMATGIQWLIGLSRYEATIEEDSDRSQSILLGQIEKVESVIEDLGLNTAYGFNQREKEIIEGLSNPDTFEQAHKLLGETLGYNAGKEETDGSPDPWWHLDEICFVFEDNAAAGAEGPLGANKARQAATHATWIKEKGIVSKGAEIYQVLITPKTTANPGAMPHLKNVLLWDVDSFRAWAKNALGVLRGLRVKFSESGDLVWRSIAMEVFKQNKIDALSLLDMLQENVAAEKMTLPKKKG